MALLDDVKRACLVRPEITGYDGELTDLINAALDDIGITDVRADLLKLTNTEGEEVELKPLIKMAVKTYCKLNFVSLDANEANRLTADYAMQKSQLLMSSTYTDRGDDDGNNS